MNDIFDYDDFLEEHFQVAEEDATEALRIREHTNGYNDGLIDGEEDAKEGEGEFLLVHETDSDYRVGYVKGYNESLRRYA